MTLVVQIILEIEPRQNILTLSLETSPGYLNPTGPRNHLTSF